MTVLKRRHEFLNAHRGVKTVRRAFVLRVGERPRTSNEHGLLIFGVGYTASKRIGGAVVRNRAKRRLREAARTVMPRAARPGCNYVLIARPDVLTCAFHRLSRDLKEAVRRVDP